MTTNAAVTPPQTRSQTCQQCGGTFTPTREWSRFCGDSCRAEHWRRDREKQSPPAVGAAAAGMGVQAEQLSAASFSQKKTKLKRILAELARGRSLHRFQAEPLGDHCLHSTIAKIEGYGIEIAREWVTVPGFAGHQTRVVRYWLDDENRQLAARLLGIANAA